MDRNGWHTAPEDGAVVVMPKQVLHGIVCYAKVPSGRVLGLAYWVKKRQTGLRRFSYSCTCEGNFLGHQLCRHIAQFKLAERC